MSEQPSLNDKDPEPFVITSISLLSEGKFLVELVEKSRLSPKGRREKWAARDSYYPSLDSDESVPTFLMGRSMIPITIQISAAEFARLQLHVGQEVLMCIVPVGA